MKKSIAIPIDVLRSGDNSEIEKYGVKNMTQEEVGQLVIEKSEYDDWFENEKYKNDRSAEYPPISELADAIYWQSKGDSSKMDSYIEKIDAVKEKYPKPEDKNG